MRANAFFFLYSIAMKYAEWYRQVTGPLRNEQGIRYLDYANKVLTGCMYIVYPAVLVYVFIFHRSLLLRYICIPGISFLLVSFFRKRINAPRPYEQGVPSLLKKATEGQSMPSRHLFSSAVISMTVLSLNGILGSLCWAITLANAVVRVLAGVHYPKDVCVGMLLGILAGLLL